MMATRMAHPMNVPSERGLQLPFDLSLQQVLGIGLISATFVLAFFIQSVDFSRSRWMLGDLAYHRGVAYTIQGGMLEGEGPYPGFISYYGGLFPMILGFLSERLGRSFDIVLSAGSWFGTLILPSALLLLGRRLWQDRWFAIGVFVLIGTFAAPFATQPEKLWVESILPSASSFWPVYPRDIAIAILLVCLWALLSPRSRTRVLGVGLGMGACVLFHAQISILMAWFLFVYAVLRAISDRSARPLSELGAAGLVAATVSSWWWLPRAVALSQTDQVLLGNHPDRVPFRPDLAGLVEAYGISLILAVIAVIGLRRLLRDSQPMGVFVVWLVAFIPLVIVSGWVPNFDLFSERRVWLISSIGLVGLATGGVLLLARRLPAWALPALVAVTVVMPSIPGTIATHHRVRNAATVAWAPGGAGMLREINVPSWDVSMKTLNNMVRARGGATVMAGDANAAWAWSFSGAQVFSLWLPGPYKLGFDLEALTGRGFLDRVQTLQNAYDHGRAGTCELAKAEKMDAVLIETRGGEVVFYDRSLASPYRVEPADRPTTPAVRSVGPGITYVDLNSQDRIRLTAGATLHLDWVAPEIDRLGLVLVEPGQVTGPLVALRGGDEAAEFIGTGVRGTRWLYMEVPDGVDGVDITASHEVEVLRLVGLAPGPEFRPLPANGTVVATVDKFCGAGQG